MGDTAATEKNLVFLPTNCPSRTSKYVEGRAHGDDLHARVESRRSGREEPRRHALGPEVGASYAEPHKNTSAVVGLEYLCVEQLVMPN